MQAIGTNQNPKVAGQNSDDEDQRPTFVKSQNFRNSIKMDPKNYNEPPTDRQVRKLKQLGFSGEIPSTRKTASDAIGELLNEQNAKNESEEMHLNCKNCNGRTHKYNALNGYCFKPECRIANPQLKDGPK